MSFSPVCMIPRVLQDYRNQTLFNRNILSITSVYVFVLPDGGLYTPPIPVADISDFVSF